MSWSHERVKRPSGNVRFDAQAVRREARVLARQYALESKGTEHAARVEALNERGAARVKTRRWLSKVERGLRLQDREINARRWLVRRGAATGSDFTAAERSELRRWFDILDADGGGDIDLSELAAPLLSTGIASSLPEVRAIITKNEAEPGGGIDFESFQRMLKRRSRSKKSGAGGVDDVREDEGFLALRQLRKHVERSQANFGVRLDSMINATRRHILLDALTNLSQDTVALRKGSSGSAGTAAGGVGAGAVGDEKNDGADAVHERRMRKLERQRARAALARRKEDKLLALWRVVIGSKDSDVAGFHSGQLPPLSTNRQEVYSDWSQRLPNMHADSDRVSRTWERVDHWMNRSCSGRKYVKDAEGNAEGTGADGGGMGVQNQSEPTLRKPKRRARVEDGPKKKLERMLSKYLRPTRADVARLEKRKSQKQRVLARSVKKLAREAAQGDDSDTFDRLVRRRRSPFAVLSISGEGGGEAVRRSRTHRVGLPASLSVPSLRGK